MALLWACPSSFPPFLQPLKHNAIPIPLSLKPKFPGHQLLRIFQYQYQFPFQAVIATHIFKALALVLAQSLQQNPKVLLQLGFSLKSREKIDVGLPGSMTERHLKKAFSQFGEVLKEKMSKLPLGSTFVWFTRKDSAEVAVEEMNGKFFDGRFIFVKIAEPGLSKDRGRRTLYKF